ncbi:hypothetical protein JCM10213_001429 [Rhodosporidiobolus nylandii]
MSFPALPYELVSHIASFLDPSPFFSAHEAPSITRARRVAGRALALVSRNAVLPGREMIWRRVVVGMHRNPEMLDRLLGSEEDSAPTELVRELVFLAGPKTARTALERELGKLLPRFGRLELLSLAATPSVLERLLSSVAGDGREAAERVRYLELHSSLGSSPSYPAALLAALPHFVSAQTLTLDLRLPSDTTLPQIPSSPAPLALRPHTLSLTIDDLDSYPPCAAFIAHLLPLISVPHLSTFSLFSAYAPPSLFSSLRSASGLASLTLSLSVGPLATRMPDLVALLPFLGELRRLKFLVQPITSAPLILSPSHALQPALLAALPAALEEFELDIDFCAPAGQLAADVRELLDSRLEDGRLQSWMSVEWEEGMAMRRAVGLVRVVRDGRAQWSMMDGEEEEGED